MLNKTSLLNNKGEDNRISIKKRKLLTLSGFFFVIFITLIFFILSMVPFYSSENNKVNKVYIQKQINNGNKKVILAFGGLLHNNIGGFRNYFEIANKNGFDFAIFSYPTTYFKQDEMNKKVLDYIKEHNYSKIGIVGLSFGEVVARNIINNLPQEIKDKIIFHISISGISVYEKINVSGCLKFLNGGELFDNKETIRKILNKHLITFDKNIAYLVGLYDKISNYKISKNLVDMKSNVDKSILKQHILNASDGLNPGIIDKIIQLYKTKDIKKNQNIPFYSFYGSNDDVYYFPKENAQYLIDKLGTGQLIEIKNGGHAELLEKPRIWNKPFKDILKQY